MRRGSSVQFSSVTQSCSALCDPMDWSTRFPCPSPTPGACLNSCPLSQLCHPTISSSVVPFSSCLQCFPASGSFLVSQFFASSSQSIEASALASVLPMNIQNWFPLGCTGLILLQSKGLSRIFSNTVVQKHQFFGAQLSLCSNSYIPNGPTLTSPVGFPDGSEGKAPACNVRDAGLIPGSGRFP